MGFNAGIYTYPKFKNEKISFKDVYYILKLVDYSSNSWAQKNFKSAEEYAKYCTDDKDYCVPSKEAIEFYSGCVHKDEYNSNVIDSEITTWCSNGGGEIYEWFVNLAKEKGIYDPSSTLCVNLNREDVAKFGQFCWDYINNILPESCMVTKAFKYVPSEDDDEEKDIRLIRCDGVEVQFEDGTTKRVETNPEYGCEFPFTKETYDSWTASGYITGMESVIKILSSVDFENTEVVYDGGW